MTSGEILKSYGLVTGDYYGNLQEVDFLTRAEMMVLLSRMMGEFEQASKYTGNTPFEDDLGHWATAYVAYAYEKGWTEGIGGDLYGYNHTLTFQETAVLMLKALGYLPDQDFSWKFAFDYAVRLGLIAPEGIDPEAPILRGDVFSVMLNTLNTNVKGSDFPLIHLVKTKPEALRVISIKPVSDYAVQVVFSEPIRTIGKVQIFYQGKILKMQSLELSGEDRVIIQLEEPLAEEVEQLISVSDFISVSDRYSIKHVEQFSYNAKFEPSYIKVITASQLHMGIEFSTPVKGLTAGHLIYGVGNIHPLGIYMDSKMTEPISADRWTSKAYIKFAEKNGILIKGTPLPVGRSSLRVAEFNEQGLGLTEIRGNAYEGGIIETTIEGDGEAPYVARFEPIGNTGLSVEFNENVRFNLSNVDIRYNSGALIPGLWLSMTGSGSKYQIQLNGADLSGKTIRINLRNVADFAFIPNVMSVHTATFWMPDLERPKIEEVLRDSGTKTIFVSFNKPVDKSSATVRSRYAIAFGNSTFVLSSAPIQVTSTLYRLSLTNTEYTLAQSSGAQLIISGIADLNGNIMDSQSYNFSSMSDVAQNSPQMVSAYASDQRSVTAVFNQPLSKVDSGAFKVNFNSVSQLKHSITSGQTIVKLQLTNDLPSNLSATTLFIDTSGLFKIQNIYGINVRNTSRVLEDRR
jgi:hypothetical protein